jgi:hypothetical protein
MGVRWVRAHQGMLFSQEKKRRVRASKGGAPGGHYASGKKGGPSLHATLTDFAPAPPPPPLVKSARL